jgi:hypothetical protein
MPPSRNHTHESKHQNHDQQNSNHVSLHADGFKCGVKGSPQLLASNEQNEQKVRVEEQTRTRMS